MAKFVVTLVVETPQDRKPPTKKAVKDAFEDLGPVGCEIWISGGDGHDYLQSKYRVRSVDLD